MKKVLFLFIFFYPLALFSQPANGDGSSGNPYSGLITTPWTLSGDYYCGDLTVSSGTFTISSGSTLRFGTGNDLTISGTGALSAVGNSSNYITFTASGTSWGHISFESSTGSSAISFCVIENGSKSGSGIEGYGGGIHANTSNLTISYSTIQNNTAIWGGGIFINKDHNPSISNCVIKENSATNGGGGLYFWNGTYSVVTNCLIYSNDVSGSSYYGGGGALIGPSSGNVKIINCTFTNNTAVVHANEVEFLSSTNARVINSILWGSNTPYYGTSSSSSFQNCAIQGGFPSGSTGCINLNASNSHGAGPNFKQTDGTDWSIKVISPCRDAGTTPSPAVPNDYAGTARLRTYDIGAYEVQYNYWLTTATSTDWATAGNWSGGIPTSSQDVVIASGATNYPTGSTSLDYTIGAGYGLVIEPGAEATFNTLTKNGDLKLMSNGTETSSLITNNSVNAIVELYLTGGGSSSTYKWHYISSPVSALPVSTFILKTTMDFAQWIESRPTLNMNQGWVGYDGYLYYGGGDDNSYDISAGNLNVGQGYNYYYSTDNKFTFSGNTIITTTSPTITYSGNATFGGFNLLGNPFSSGLDWTTIIYDAGFPSSTSKGLYFTRNNAQCSFIAGVGYPDASVTGIIPPMQGFFIHTTNTSTTLPLLAGARAHNIPARYKGESEIIPLVRLQLDNDTLMDNTVVRFDSKAEATLDNDFDAVRMFLSDEIQYIYSTDGVTKYAINGQPFPETTLQIPLAVNILTSGNHSITASQLQGLETYNIGLKDNTTGFTADLKSNPTILFSSGAGTSPDRFVLVVSGIATAIPENPGTSEKAFNIYHYQDMLNIQALGDEWDGKQASINIYNLTGKITGSQQNVELWKNSLIQVPANLTKGIYVVEIKSGVQRYTGKVVIK